MTRRDGRSAAGSSWSESRMSEVSARADTSEDPTLHELEEALDEAQAASYTSYVREGELWERIAITKAYRQAGKESFKAYVEEVRDERRTTVYEKIRASRVARDVVPVQLPQRHAQLLYRFESEWRRRLAEQIERMNIREATRHVLKIAEELYGKKGRRRPRRDPASELRLLMTAVREINERDVQAVEAALGGLSPADERKAASEARRAMSILSEMLVEKWRENRVKGGTDGDCSM